MEDGRPELSVVVAVRNDNYGGDFAERLQTSIDWNTRWLEHYRIATEFVLVNWNPLTERPDLTETVRWPLNREYVTYRMVEVPAGIHNKYVDPRVRNTVPMFEFIAKNAGIRRAKGKNILCTNADILIHPRIFEFLAHSQLAPDTYYRADRLDFRKTETHRISDFWQHGFAISLKGFMYSLRGPAKPFQVHLLRILNSFRLRWELLKFQHSRLADRLKLNVVRDNGAYLAHCLNSGDFMLMPNGLWDRMKGYPEYTRISTHTDAIFTVLANQRYSEVVLHAPVFHQEHERRYAWDDIKKDSMFEETYRLFEDISNEVKEGKDTHRFLNTDDWGLAHEDLPLIEW
ncbi:MAG: hypothetical protein GC178_03300 [Flavobacteriales bacterium]|nr:hypothetical protein [Flavobacteriales bacterium]